MGATVANGTQRDIEALMPTEESLVYEAELLKDPYNLKIWLEYLDSIGSVESVEAVESVGPTGSSDQGNTTRRRQVVYERALKALPGSYKLWHRYLLERKHHLEQGRYVLTTPSLALPARSPARSLARSPAHSTPFARPIRYPIDSPLYKALNNTFERALISMYKMPRIWLEYLEFLVSQGFITRTRRAFDRALMALPVTQHDRVWVMYLKFVSQEGIPVETTTRCVSVMIGDRLGPFWRPTPSLGLPLRLSHSLSLSLTLSHSVSLSSPRLFVRLLSGSTRGI